MSIYLSIHLLYLSNIDPSYPSIIHLGYPSIYPSRLSIYLSIQAIYLSIYSSRLSIYLSIYIYAGYLCDLWMCPVIYKKTSYYELLCVCCAELKTFKFDYLIKFKRSKVFLNFVNYNRFIPFLASGQILFISTAACLDSFFQTILTFSIITVLLQTLNQNLTKLTARRPFIFS